jgi:hypothetical protein
MSYLEMADKRSSETFLEMSSGYVLAFYDSTFGAHHEAL